MRATIAYMFWCRLRNLGFCCKCNVRAKNLGIASFGCFEVCCYFVIVLVFFFGEVIVQGFCCAEILQIQ